MSRTIHRLVVALHFHHQFHLVVALLLRLTGNVLVFLFAGLEEFAEESATWE